MMGFIWFWLVAVMIVGYVVLDGFDLGVGMLHLFLVRTETERRVSLHSIGPVWDGNEVWLLAGGGTLYFAFPLLYASAFSGFYLPLMIVLWLLVLRGISLELRNHIDVGVWTCSARRRLRHLQRTARHLLRCGTRQRAPRSSAAGRRLLLPAALDQLAARPHPGILDWYTVIGGLVALVALTLHGALWLAIKVSGDLAKRASRSLRRSGSCSLVAHRREPHRHHRRASRTASTTTITYPFTFIVPVGVLASLAGIWFFNRGHQPVKAFLSFVPLSLLHACWRVLGRLSHAASGQHRRRSRHHPRPRPLRPHTLAVGLAWWTIRHDPRRRLRGFCLQPLQRQSGQPRRDSLKQSGRDSSSRPDHPPHRNLKI